MDKIISQFRRIYSDNGAGDHDFTEQEAKLREAHDNLTNATEALIKSSERLNIAAINAFSDKKFHH